MSKNIKVARHRNFPYVVNYPSDNGNVKMYQWTGSKGNKKDVKDIPEEVVNYLVMNSVCFEDGELVIASDSKEAKEIKDNIGDKESYDNNTQDKDEIKAILESSVKDMKAGLNKITNKDQKKFVVDVAKEIKLDSSAKQKFIAEWFGVKQDILFAEDE